MILEQKHIEYLRSVETGVIRIWWAPRKVTSRYVNSTWNGGKRVPVDQSVAAQAKALGLTHIVHRGGNFYVELTKRGQDTLSDEDENEKESA